MALDTEILFLEIRKWWDKALLIFVL